MPSITKVLIANRGEIACRILKTVKTMGLAGVVVYHPADADSPAVRLAHEAVPIDGATPVAAYLDPDVMVRACRCTGADAVHPGFGFLAENAGFARRLADEGITFIGPAPEVIELMGDKAAARAFCLENGFPVGLSVTEDAGEAEFISRLHEMGPPVVIKAVAGGGGKGMHVAEDMDDLDRAVRVAKDEARRFFGDGRVYAERLLARPRHVEVQVLADHHGRVIHVGERDCSVQRRFQKIIEESPAPALPDGLREDLCRTAVEIAHRAGYTNAGTVEFLVAEDGAFHFLEMNTRIQVEHPVTEMVAGLDLVEQQINVAAGRPLGIDQQAVALAGHAVEVRVYAEDPDNGFLPATGPLLAWRLPTGPGVRVDNGFEQGMRVTAAFDPMLAKIIAWGPTRAEALARLARALDETLILGVATNLDYLRRLVTHPAFEAGRVHTAFIVDHEPDLAPPPVTEKQRDLLLTVAVLSTREFTDPALAVPEPYASMGNWRN